MATSIGFNLVISDIQEKIYPGTVSENYWSEKGKDWFETHHLLGRVALIPIACADAVMEIFKKTFIALGEIFAGLDKMLSSIWTRNVTARQGFRDVKYGLATTVKILIVPFQFGWQLIQILKNEPKKIRSITEI